MEVTKREGNYFVKVEKDEGLDDDNDIKKTLASQLRAFKLSNSKRIMNNFFKETKGFYSNSICHTDTDSFYMKKKLMGCSGQSWCSWIYFTPR